MNKSEYEEMAHLKRQYGKTPPVVIALRIKMLDHLFQHDVCHRTAEIFDGLQKNNGDYRTYLKRHLLFPININITESVQCEIVYISADRPENYLKVAEQWAEMIVRKEFES